MGKCKRPGQPWSFPVIVSAPGPSATIANTNCDHVELLDQCVLNSKLQTSPGAFQVIQQQLLIPTGVATAKQVRVKGLLASCTFGWSSSSWSSQCSFRLVIQQRVIPVFL